MRVTRIGTVGYSTRALADFMTLLTSNAIQAVADGRRFVLARNFPHFNQTDLSRALDRAGVKYLHLPELEARSQEQTPQPPANASTGVPA